MTEYEHEHAELQILRAAKDLLEATPAVVERIYINRTSTITADDELPAVFLSFGEDDATPLANTRITSQMELLTDIVLRSRDGEGRELSRIRTEIHRRLMTNRQLGLRFVIDTLPAGAEEPEVDTEPSVPVVQRRLRWAVQYTTDITDPTRLS